MAELGNCKITDPEKAGEPIALNSTGLCRTTVRFAEWQLIVSWNHCLEDGGFILILHCVDIIMEGFGFCVVCDK